MRMRILQIVFSFFGFLGCRAQSTPVDVIHSGENPPAEVDAFIKKRIDSIFTRKKIPGILVGISIDGKRSYYTAGYANPVSKEVFDSTTIFEAGSITKTLTAHLLVSILKEKNIPLNSTIAKFLPDSVKFNPNITKITFESLLNHTSGLPRLPDNMDLNSKQPYELYDQKKLFEYLMTASPNPTDRSQYSNLGFGLAGVLATIISGKPYGQLIEEYVFGKLKIPRNPAPNAQGYLGDDAVDFWKFDAMSGAGAVRCNATELLSYLEAYMNPPGSEFAYIKNTTTKITASVAGNMTVGLGWHLMRRNATNDFVYWHNGGTYGFSTFAGFDDRNAVVVVINKFDQNGTSDKLGFDILSRMKK